MDLGVDYRLHERAKFGRIAALRCPRYIHCSASSLPPSWAFGQDYEVQPAVKATSFKCIFPRPSKQALIVVPAAMIDNGLHGHHRFSEVVKLVNFPNHACNCDEAHHNIGSRGEDHEGAQVNALPCIQEHFQYPLVLSRGLVYSGLHIVSYVQAPRQRGRSLQRYLQENRKSFNTGDPENSGFSNMQLRKMIVSITGTLAGRAPAT